jgi:cation transport ATPase
LTNIELTNIEAGVVVTAQATFGRDGAMFESLLGFVAQLSMVLWSVVILTAVIRFIGIRIYRNGAARADSVQTAAPRTAVTVAAPVAVILVSPDSPRAEPRSREKLPAHAHNSVEL